MLAAGLKGIVEGYALPAGGRGRRVGAHRLRSAARWATRSCRRRASTDALEQMEESGSLAETLGEQVFDYVLLQQAALNGTGVPQPRSPRSS